MRRAKAEAEEMEEQERLVRDELEKKRKYEEDLRNRTERGEKLNSRPSNSTKSSITRPRDKDFYKKRKGDLKRKLVVRLVKIVWLLPWRTGLMKTWSSLMLQVLVVRGILKLPCIFFNST
jgi:hypothetical protein